MAKKFVMIPNPSFARYDGMIWFECQHCFVCFPTDPDIGKNCVKFDDQVIVKCPCLDCNQTEIQYFPDEENYLCLV